MRGAQKKWTDDAIERELRAIVQIDGRFPSCSDLRTMGRNDLVCAVTKAGGLIHWADRLGCDRSFSDSDYGWQGEAEFIELCAARGLSAVRAGGVKHPWDVTIDAVLRIDVKTAHLATYGRTSGWYYRIGKAPQADVVVLYQSDTNDFYGLPWNICPTSNVTLSQGGGKYACYLNNWKLIEEMIAVRKGEANRVA